MDAQEDQYIMLVLPESLPPSAFHLVVWRGPESRFSHFERMLKEPVEMIDLEQGSPAHWPEEARRPALSRWGRRSSWSTTSRSRSRIRAAQRPPFRRGFFDDGRAAVVTFESDVWIVSGIDEELERLRWKRFASVLYEPLSLQTVEGAIYVQSRSGIVRLHDLDGEGEADFYENFSDLPIQSGETREAALELPADRGLRLRPFQAQR